MAEGGPHLGWRTHRLDTWDPCGAPELRTEADGQLAAGHLVSPSTSELQGAWELAQEGDRESKKEGEKPRGGAGRDISVERPGAAQPVPGAADEGC